LGERSISKASFEMLLTWLSQDRAEAGEQYERLRWRLIRILENRGAADPEALTDEVFNRVCRRLEEGTVDTRTDPARFLHGIAKNVLQEDLRKQAASRRMAQHLPNAAATASRTERQLLAMERCLNALPQEDLSVLLRYEDGDGLPRIQARARLAVDLGLTPGALRIRIARIRKSLSACIREQAGAEDPPNGGAGWE